MSNQKELLCQTIQKWEAAAAGIIWKAEPNSKRSSFVRWEGIFQWRPCWPPSSLSQWESILGQTPPTIPLSHALKSCQQCHPLPHPYQPPHPYLLHLHPCPDLNLISTKSWIDSFWTFGDLTGQLDLNWDQSVRHRPLLETSGNGWNLKYITKVSLSDSRSFWTYNGH